MVTQTNVSPRDALDIVFQHRNRAYGAYQLQRAYPRYLIRAFLISQVLILLALLAPKLLKAVNALAPPPEIVYAPSDGPLLIEKEPAIPPPPRVETPPPPTRSTVKFVPPVVEKDEDVAAEKPPAVEDLAQQKEDIGTETKAGNDDAPPAIESHPSELDIVEVPVQETEKTYGMIDISKLPAFPGGERELLVYLAKNIQYPPPARENNIQGVVVLSFVVSKNGSVQEVQIVKDIGGGCGKEAVRVVQTMPKWNPGEANGHPVKVRFTLPVRFRLN
ncbi:MAG: TonB family protein [Lewinellaceae bacterium]|nr:TonB family protein [Saprospiraceae bacterium]MCB9353643.1 TonB family protein [Lewinellaceae bacterium]